MEEKEIEWLIEKSIKKAFEAQRKKQSSKAYKLTFFYLKSYKDMKKSLKSNTQTKTKEKNPFLEEIEKSKIQTARVLEIINEALKELEEEQEKKGQKCKTDALKKYFFEGKTYEQISEEITTGDSTPRRWVSEMVARMAIKLFGVDATGLD